jgi:hypothetical protein
METTSLMSRGEDKKMAYGNKQRLVPQKSSQLLQQQQQSQVHQTNKEYFGFTKLPTATDRMLP